VKEYLAEMQAAILACDQARLSRLMFCLGMTADNIAEVERQAERLMAEAPHDVQVYWSGECNCDGHQN
jgi:hypothetical protein